MRLRILVERLRIEQSTFLLMYRMIDLWLCRGVADQAFVKQVTLVARFGLQRSDISYGRIQAANENLHFSSVWGLVSLE